MNSARYGSRTASSIRPLTSMRPISSNRLKSSDQMRPASSLRYSLNSSSSSRISLSPPKSSSSNSNLISYADSDYYSQHSDASNLTVGPTFQGNPLKSLLSRKKNSTLNFSANQNDSKIHQRFVQ